MSNATSIYIYVARTIRHNANTIIWRLAMVNLIIAVLLWITAAVTGKALFYLLATTVFLLGFAMAVVIGMLLKIIAFLIWLHLQGLRDRLSAAARPVFNVTNMKMIIPSRNGNQLLALLIAAELALIGAFIAPQIFFLPAALLWLATFSVLAWILSMALLRYHRTVRTVTA